MKAKKSLVLFLVSCLCLGVFLCLCVGAATGAEDAATGLSTGQIVSLVIGGLLLVGAIVLCIVKRKPLGEKLRAYKSELHKIVWYPWKHVRRSTLVVVVIVVVTATVIGLLDYVFFSGLELLTRIGK